jgi:hypothetical protein
MIRAVRLTRAANPLNNLAIFAIVQPWICEFPQGTVQSVGEYPIN